MKSRIHTKLFCIVLLISLLNLSMFNVSMFTSGLHCGEPLPSSSFSCAAETRAAAVMHASDGVFNSHIYHEENRLTGLGEFTLARQTPRTVTVMRLNPLSIMLFLTGAFTLFAIFFTIFSLQGSRQNQCRLRTLQYIHRKDGKKHNS